MATRLRSSTRRAAAAANESISLSSKLLAEPKRSSRVSRQQDKPNPEEEELKRVKRVAIIATVLANLFLLGIYMLITESLWQFHPKNITTAEFKGFAHKVEYTLKYQSLLIVWLVFNIHYVIYKRLTSGAINPLTQSTEHEVQAAKSILTNSFEQIFVSLFAQLAFISFADSTITLKLVPAINIVQFIGRVSFFAGYPTYRTFGFMLTSIPNTVMVMYNLYRFCIWINLY